MLTLKQFIKYTLIGFALGSAVTVTVAQGPYGPLESRIGYADDSGALKAVSVGDCGTLGPSGPMSSRIVRTDSNGALYVCGVTGGGSGDVATDTIWNAAGDLVVGTGSDTAARLAKGAANTVLHMKSDGSTVEWASTLAGLTFTTPVIGAATGTSLAFGSDPADAGVLRLENNTAIAWEAATPGTDLTLTLNGSDVFVFSVDATVPDEAYGAGWNGSLEVPTKNAVYDKIEAAGAGATAYDDIADPDANGSIAFAGFTNTWTSTLDSGVVFLITDTDADAASDTTLLKLSHDDGGDANVIYLDLINDADGTPTSILKILQTLATFTVDVVVPTEAYDATAWNGSNEVPTKDAVRDILETFVTITDPGADYIMFWDDSDGAVDFLTTMTGLTISGNTLAIDTTWDATFNSLSLEAAGVKLSGDDDGAITFLGLGNGSDEDLTINLDDTANTIVLSSSTGVTTWNFGGFALINTVFDAEGTSNTLTIPTKIQFNAGICQNATASVGFSTPSTLGAAGGCHTVAAASGDPAYGYAVFPTGGADTELHGQIEIPSDWTGAIDVTLKWNAVSTTANDVVWEIAFGCVADGEAATAISFNETAFTAVTNKTTTLQFNTATKTGITTTGCAAGETGYFIIHRDTDTAGDTLDADVNLISVIFTIRRGM